MYNMRSVENGAWISRLQLAPGDLAEGSRKMRKVDNEPGQKISAECRKRGHEEYGGTFIPVHIATRTQLDSSLSSALIP